MFNPLSRMTLPTRLLGFAALAIVSAAAAPASAAKWTQATSVEAVCKRTGCYMDTTSNGAVTFGCGVNDGKGHNCFICDNKKGKCYGVRPSAVQGKRSMAGLGGVSATPLRQASRQSIAAQRRRSNSERPSATIPGSPK